MIRARPWLLLLFGLTIIALWMVPRRMFVSSSLPPSAKAPPRVDPPAPTPPAPPPAVAADPMREWTSAILRRDERMVVASQSFFLSKEEEYRPRLMAMAAEHGEPRVRAFTVAVLGRMKSPPPEEWFVARLGDAHEYPRTSALQALERLGTAACLGKVDALASSDPADAVRAAAGRTSKAVRSR